MNPFLSTPEAAQFWRDSTLACLEAERLICKHPVFARFLALGGKIEVVRLWVGSSVSFTALWRHSGQIVATVAFSCVDDQLPNDPFPNPTAYLDGLIELLTEARDGARELPTAAQIARARIEVEVNDAPKRLEADNDRPKYNIHKAC